MFIVGNKKKKCLYEESVVVCCPTLKNSRSAASEANEAFLTSSQIAQLGMKLQMSINPEIIYRDQ